MSFQVMAGVVVLFLFRYWSPPGLVTVIDDPAAEKAPCADEPRAFWKKLLAREGTPLTDIVTLHLPTIELFEVHCIVARGENDGLYGPHWGKTGSVLLGVL